MFGGLTEFCKADAGQGHPAGLSRQTGAVHPETNGLRPIKEVNIMSIRQSGFTLIELIVVIVILGILAATAIPRFSDLSVNARVASADGVEGAMRSASALAHAQALVNGVTSGNITMEGATVTVTGGYATEDNAGIGTAMTTSGGSIGCAAGGTGYQCTIDNITGCTVEYDADTTPPTITNNADTTSCE